MVIVFAITTVIYFLLQLVPGDPAQVLLQSAGDPETIAALRHELGLDRPVYVQYFSWLSGLLRGDFGTSLLKGKSVTSLIVKCLPITLSVAVFAELFALYFGIPAGCIAAIKSRSFLDHAFMGIAILGVSMPTFWLGLNLMFLFGVKLQVLPIAGYVAPSESIAEWLRHLILPGLSLGLMHSALIARMTRCSVLEQVRQDYTRTARAKGLPESRVLGKHVLRNSLAPVVTIVGMTLPRLLVGTVIVETVFALPGTGRLLIKSIMQRDYMIMQAAIVLLASLSVLSAFIVDFIYTTLDPRIRYY